MEAKNLSTKLHEALQELIGFHRQLYEVVKAENVSLVSADVKGTFDAATTKEALVHWIHQAEMSRQAIVQALAEQEDLQSPSLKDLIIYFQGKDSELSNQLQIDLNSLVILVERIQNQNRVNGKLVEESLKHIHNMKRNIFGEVSPAKTYNQQGQKNQTKAGAAGPRFISKEV